MAQAVARGLEDRAAALAAGDADLAEAIRQGEERRAAQISLLPGEVHPSRAVREAEGSWLAALWAEGPAGGRLSAGTAAADAVEDVARRRVRDLFGADHANVQPDSAHAALLAAYHALAAPGDAVLAPDPSQGAPQVHGGAMSLPGRLYRFVHYGVDRETGSVDLGQVEALARRWRPRLVVAGGNAWSEGPDYGGFAAVAAACRARLLVDARHAAGLVAAGLRPNPTPLADAVVICTRHGLRGPRGGAILCRAEHARAVDRAVWPGLQSAPAVAAIAAKAVCFREAAHPEFREYQRRIVANRDALAAGLARAGLSLVESAAPSQIVVLDLRAVGIHGRAAERACEQAGVLAGRAPVPQDPVPPPRCSGLRVGTGAATSRGLGPGEMAEVADLLASAISAATAERAPGTDAADDLAALAQRTAALAARFPAPV